MSAPQVVILAGPNGAGKSTLSSHVIHEQLGIVDYVNADTIARGLAAFDPERRAFEAGRYMLDHLRKLAAYHIDFAFETTLATRSFATWIDDLLDAGYEFGLIFIWLPSADLSIERVSGRVLQGGHHVPESDIRRRYERGLVNFFSLYQPRATWWQMYNGVSKSTLLLVAEGSRRDTWTVYDAALWNGITKGH